MFKKSPRKVVNCLEGQRTAEREIFGENRARKEEEEKEEEEGEEEEKEKGEEEEAEKREERQPTWLDDIVIKLSPGERTCVLRSVYETDSLLLL